MEALLDTTIQIDRIFKRGKKEKIKKYLGEHECGSSTYVLGEFKNNIIKDCIALCNIMQIEDSLSGVRKNINEKVFNRSFQRMYYIFDDLCDLYEEQYELIKEELLTYSKRLERRFYYGISQELLNETGCHRAGAVIVQGENVIKLQGIGCTQKDDFCNICDFWKENINLVEGLDCNKTISIKMKKALSAVKEDCKKAKGNNCKSLGDCIIAVEALNTEKKAVYTSNLKDFKPICDHIGVDII